MTPYESFVDWFNDLPLKYRQDLISDLAEYLPGIELNPYHRLFVQQFFEKIDAIRAKGIIKEHGLMICIKALIDKLVDMHLALSESFEEEKAELEEMAKLTGSCSLAAHASERVTHIIEWQAIASAWNRLKADVLSDEAIEKAYPFSIE